ncbi:fibronectin type III domain-containing protein [Microbacterium radiodurans]|uniref:alpha-amylase n=1 Tax=Microbacterium radiodurans TaxID=661398 RepID=A0A5J5IQ96_9MICO|nr:fibronectin type III domain-containing protein [Microbacterium radiodurans]KAA9084117.1 hypothetical protein F6B42_14125 [Microbacterium radiodurans]
MASRRGAPSRLLASVVASAAAVALVLSGASISFADTAEPAAPPAAVEVAAVTDPASPEVPASVAPPSTDAVASAPAAEPAPAPAAPAAPAPVPAPDAAPAAPAPAAPAPPREEAPARDAAADPAAAFAASAEPAEFFFDGDPREIVATPGAAGVATLTGTVVDAGSGAPVAGVRVWAASSGGDNVPAANAVRTASDGTFTVTIAEGSGFYGFEIGQSVETIHLGAYGSLAGVAFDHAYDLGVLTVERGALLSGRMAAPTADVAGFEAYVSIVPVGGSGPQFWWGGDIAAGGSTAWQTVVAPGTYTVEFSNRGQFASVWWQNATTAASATPVAVAVGQSRTGIDATFTLGANRLSGTVRSAAGAPLAGVAVTAIGGSGNGNGSAWATTDAQGRYLLSNLAAGEYRLEFRPRAGDGLTAHFRGATAADAERIVVGTDTVRTGLDVAVVRGGTVTGTIPAELRGDATRVSLTGDRTSGYLGAALGADGSFAVTDVAPGTYVLAVDGRTQLFLPGAVVMRGAETVALDLSSLRAGDLTVTVAADLTGSQIALVDAGSNAGTNTVVASRWMASGETATFRVPAGDYLVRFTGAGGVATYFPASTSPRGATVLTVAPDAPQAITLTGGTGEISGTIVDIDGSAALAGIAVELYRADQLDGSPTATTVTGDDGAFAFAGLGINNYAVRAVGGASLYVDRWFGPSGGRSDATAIEIGDGGRFADADLALTLGGGVSGTLADTAQFTTWDRLYLSFRQVDTGLFLDRRVTVGDIQRDGSWAVLGLPAGDYDLLASLGSDSLTGAGRITIERGEVTGGIALALPATQLSGIVTSPTGTPAYAEVTAHWTDPGMEWESTRTTYTNSTTGAYRLNGVPQGAEVRLEFSGRYAGLGTQWWQGAATKDAATPITIGAEPVVANAQLPAGIPVSGRLIDAVSGEPVAGVYVNSGAYTGPDGRFRTTAPAPGRFDLQTQGGDRYVAATLTFDVPDAGLADVEIALERGYVIRGTVSAENNGAALSGVSVTAYDAGSAMDWRGSAYSAGGTFSTQALAPGRYKLQASNPSGLYVAQWFDGADTFADARIIEIVDRDVDLDLMLGLGGTASGRVVDSAGAPIAGARVGVATAPQTGIARFFADAWSLVSGAPAGNPILGIEVTTDANGEFRLPPLEAGDYTMYVTSEGLGTIWFDGAKTRAEADVIRITPGQTVTFAGSIELPALAEGEEPLSPEQTLSADFAIIANPVDVSADAGTDAVFTALASGLPAPTVQWQVRPGGGKWADIVGAIDSRLTVPAVTAADDGSEYRAVFARGAETLTSGPARLSVTEPASAPAAPAAPTIGEVTTTSVALTWSAPADGGSPITGYRVEVFEKDAATPVRTVPLGNVRAQTIGGLTPGIAYEVSVSAVNAVGVGAASSRAAVTTLALTAPGAPTGLAIGTTTPTSIAVSWSAPASTGGTPITGYVVSARPAGAAMPTTVVEVAAGLQAATLTALASDTEYEIAVVARNAVGDGAPATTTARTAEKPPVLIVPGAPTDVRTTDVGTASIVLGWTAPASDGGSPITGYVVTVATGGQVVAAAVEIDGERALVGGLAPATAYEISVAAVNAIGTGAPSTPLPVTTATPAAVVPEAPTAVSAGAATVTSVVVTWGEPESDGGAAVLGYDIVVLAGGEPVAAQIVVNGTEAIVSGLAPDTAYEIVVAARNVVGAGPGARAEARTLTATDPGTGEPGTGGPGTGEPTPAPTTPAPSPTPGTTAPGLPSTGPSAQPVAPASASLTDASRGGLTLAPGTVAPGDTVRMSGLDAGRTYHVWFFSTPTFAGTVTADAVGTALVRVPAGLAPGAHRIVAVDAATGEVAGWEPVTVAARLAATGGQLPVAGALFGGILLLAGLSLAAAGRARRSA